MMNVTEEPTFFPETGSQVSSMEYTLLQQLDASESSTSLRDRAEALEVSKWSRANVQRNSADEIHNHKGAEGDAFNTSQDPVKFRWAWTLWDAEIKAASPSQGKEEAIYGLVARASKSRALKGLNLLKRTD